MRSSGRSAAGVAVEAFGEPLFRPPLPSRWCCAALCVHPARAPLGREPRRADSAIGLFAPRRVSLAAHHPPGPGAAPPGPAPLRRTRCALTVLAVTPPARAETNSPLVALTARPGPSAVSATRSGPPAARPSLPGRSTTGHSCRGRPRTSVQRHPTARCSLPTSRRPIASTALPPRRWPCRRSTRSRSVSGTSSCPRRRADHHSHRRGRR